MKKTFFKGFTLIELLIVIAVIGILAVGAFVALNPGVRLQDSRDSRRWTDVTALLEAIKVDQVDNKGPYFPALDAAAAGATIRMLGTCAATSNCNAAPVCSDAPIVGLTDGIDPAALVTEGYLAAVPVAPAGAAFDAVKTGYYIVKNTNGTIKIGACDSENTTAISVQR